MAKRIPPATIDALERCDWNGMYHWLIEKISKMLDRRSQGYHGGSWIFGGYCVFIFFASLLVIDLTDLAEGTWYAFSHDKSHKNKAEHNTWKIQSHLCRSAMAGLLVRAIVGSMHFCETMPESESESNLWVWVWVKFLTSLGRKKIESWNFLSHNGGVPIVRIKMCRAGCLRILRIAGRTGRRSRRKFTRAARHGCRDKSCW